MAVVRQHFIIPQCERVSEDNTLTHRVRKWKRYDSMEVSFEVIQERNKNAGTIFLLCAFLNSSDLFYDLFQIGTNPNKLSQAVEAGDDPRPTWLCDLGREELAFLDVIKTLVFLTFSFLRPREYQ
jgi:hypothetical protein